VALQKMRNRLDIDHKNAMFLAYELSKIQGIKVHLEDIHINIVFFDMKETGFSSDKLVKEFLARGIKINGEDGGEMRFVTNYWVTEDDVDFVVKSLKEVLGTVHQ